MVSPSSCRPRRRVGQLGRHRAGHGTVAGRRGTFLPHDAGTVVGNVVRGEWFVVPGSGAGEPAGRHRAGGFRANPGAGAQVHLDHWFE